MVHFTGIKIQSERNDFIHFHATFWRDGAAFLDNNRDNEYAVGLGWSLDNLSEEELPPTVAIRTTARLKVSRSGSGAGFRMFTTPVFDSGQGGRFDGMGRAK